MTVKINFLRRVVRQGPGKGHHGHAGRPGKVGGSLPGKGKGVGEKGVGLTSARPGRDEPEIVLEDMKDFEESLREIEGVSNVSVEFGEGGWEGGSEPTWVISYDGNGEALKLIAQTGKKFNQDGVLLYEACSGKGCSPVVTWTFGRARAHQSLNRLKKDVNEILVEGGISGWTWYNDGEQIALRAISVPQWGSDAKTHMNAVNIVSESIKATGLKAIRDKFDATVTVMEQSGEFSYGSFIESE